MYDFLVLFQIAGVFLSFFLICFSVRENSYLNSKYLILTLTCAFIHSCALILEFFSANEEAALIAVKIQYIGLCFSAPALLFFILEFCVAKVNKLLYWGTVVINVFFLACVFTCEWHNLFYTSYEFVAERSYNHIVFENGIVYYLFIMVRLIIAVYMIYITLLNFIKYEKEKESTRKNFLITISAIIPSVFIFIDSLGIVQIPDFTAFGFILSCLFFIAVIYKYHFFDLVQSAKELIIKNMIEAIIVVDRNFKYLESNLAARSIFPRLKYMKKGDKINRCSIIISEILKKGGKNDFELKGKFYNCHVSPIYDGDYIKGYAACIFDVTEAHYYTEQLIRMKDESDAANRAKSDFLANVSHEIRTPMNAIIGLSEIVLRGELNEDQRGNIRSILTSSKSLLTIINNILDLSKIESGKFEIIDEDYNISNVLHDVYNIIKVRLHDKPIEFNINVPCDLPSMFKGDNIRIKEILFNILGNAVKFTNSGSINLTVEWQRNKKYKNDDNIVTLIMRVSDTGIGIKKEDMKKLFQTYNQVDTRKNRSISGTGLGLAISKNLAEMMGGYINVESVYGEGTTFIIAIKQKVIDFKPINRDCICEEDSGDFDEEKNSFLNEKIISIPQAKVLIVDDISVNLQVSKGLMEPYNMKVDVALNGTEAIKMIKEKDYDLVFMDHMMPNMDGVDVTRVIRGFPEEKYKKLPIIALTANALTSSREFFIKNGFNGFLAKPIDLKQLNKVLYDFLPIKIDNKDKDKDVSDKSDVNIRGIDYSVGLKNVGDNTESYYKILKSYLRESLEMYKELDGLIKNDIDTFRIKIHGLKSSSANIGAISVSEKARRLEMAAKDLDAEYIDRNISEFYSELLELLDNIKVYVDDYEKKNKNDNKQVFENLEHKLLLDIKNAAGHFDITSMENAIAQINKYTYTEDINEFIKELETYIDGFEYDKCIDLISEYEEKMGMSS